MSPWLWLVWAIIVFLLLFFGTAALAGAYQSVTLHRTRAREALIALEAARRAVDRGYGPVPQCRAHRPEPLVKGGPLVCLNCGTVE